MCCEHKGPRFSLHEEGKTSGLNFPSTMHRMEVYENERIGEGIPATRSLTTGVKKRSPTF